MIINSSIIIAVYFILVSQINKHEQPQTCVSRECDTQICLFCLVHLDLLRHFYCRTLVSLSLRAILFIRTYWCEFIVLIWTCFRCKNLEFLHNGQGFLLFHRIRRYYPYKNVIQSFKKMSLWLVFRCSYLRI